MRVFLTGITGTLGSALTDLHHSRGDQVFGCARNESKAVEWLSQRGRMATLFISSAAALDDPSSDISRLLPSIDRLYHCAAMKHVDLCEKNPGEAFEQNVRLTETVCRRCFDLGVPFVFISSDKACLPQGIYGATKLIGERIATRHGGAAVRFGNLIGSSGSVFKAWKEAVARGERIKLTDPEMTRFFISVKDAAEFAAGELTEGVVSVPSSMDAARIGDLAHSLAGYNVDVIGLRLGETQHQWIVAPGDKVKATKNSWIITEQGAPSDGICSDSASRWDSGELLETAGCLTMEAAA